MAEALREVPTDSRAIFEELCRSSETRLREVFRNGVRPDPASLDGHAFCGFNVTPVAKVLGFQKFVKCFFTVQGSEFLEGCNLWVRPSSPRGEWVLAPKRPHGFYVVFTEWNESWGPSQKNALRIDYAASSRNHRLNPERMIIDYLVQPDPADPDCFLGKAFLGTNRLNVFSNYFVLLRHQRSSEIIAEKLSHLPLRSRT
jgi:hypothetical protein